MFTFLTTTAIMFPVVMVLMIPVTFMHPPALLVMIVMRMAPITAHVGGLFPLPCHPTIAIPVRRPVPVDPGITRTGHLPSLLIALWWWRASDIHADLRRSSNRDNNREKQSTKPIQFHFFISS